MKRGRSESNVEAAPLKNEIEHLDIAPLKKEDTMPLEGDIKAPLLEWLCECCFTNPIDATSCALCGFRITLSAKRPAYPDIVIGTAGFSYNEWVRGNTASDPERGFFPTTIDHAHYAARFNGVELNASFYDDDVGQPSVAKNFGGWQRIADAARPYAMVLKMARSVTHHEGEVGQLLVAARAKLAAYRAPFVACVLLQFPPRFVRTPQSAAYVAGLLGALGEGQRAAFEFRNRSWFCNEAYALFAGYPHATLVQTHVKNARGKGSAAEWAGDLGDGVWPNMVVYDELSANKTVCYVRLHGSEGQAVGTYGGAALEGVAQRVMRWRDSGKWVGVFFNNTESFTAASGLPSAVDDAFTLTRMMGANEA